MKWLLKIPVYILSVLSVVVAMGILVPKLVFNIEPLYVQSGSMSPTIPTGSLVFAVPVGDGDEIEVGDVIAYTINAKSEKVTHRVVEVDRENRRLVVKGDANDVKDPVPVIYENVVGVIRVHVPLVGYAFGYVQQTEGMIIMGTVIVALILLILLSGSGEEEDEEAELLEEVATLQVAPTAPRATQEEIQVAQAEPEESAETQAEPEKLDKKRTEKKKKYSQKDRYTPRY